jgi:serine/threonine-protein kinase
VLNDRYRIVKLLGQGGFGAVYRAWDINLERPCAFKENLDTSPQAQRQFEREAKILANLDHPNLPRVTDHFFVPGQGQYLVMDFVEGEDLEQMLLRIGGSLPEPQVLSWIVQVCDALSYLHSQNPPVIHRDIKPSNIKITPDGVIKLVDFGIAKVYDPGLSTTMGAKAVTPGFSPPEQYGMRSTDVRADVYALGATLYNLLTGKMPPESILRSTGSLLDAPRVLNPATSPAMERAIMKATQMVPEQRFQSVGDFKTALLGEASMPSTPPRVMLAGRKPAAQPARAPGTTERRPINWTWVGVIGVVVVTLALGLLVLGGKALFSGGGAPATDTPTSTATDPGTGARAIQSPEGPSTLQPTPQPSFTPRSFPTPAPMARLYDGNALGFADPPAVVAYANVEEYDPPEGIVITDSGGLWRYKAWAALMEANDWIEVENVGLDVNAIGVQFHGDTNDGWAHVFLDGEEVWQGSVYGPGVSAEEAFIKYLEITNLAPGPHVLRVTTYGVPGLGGGDDVSIYFFGFK